MVLFVFYISICVEKKEGAILIIRKLLTNKISLWIGDVSYSVYLIHLLVILPVLAFLIQDYELLNTSPFIRFSLVAIICVPIVYSLSFLTYNYIEKNGIEFGKLIIKRFARSYR